MSGGARAVGSPACARVSHFSYRWPDPRFSSVFPAGRGLVREPAPGCPRVGGIGGCRQLLLSHLQEVEHEKQEEMLQPATFAADRTFKQEGSLGWAAFSALCTWTGAG